MKKVLTLLLLTFTLHLAKAQYSFVQQNNIPFKIGAKTLTNPWAGGINSGQFSKIKLDNDEVEDLIVFDRTSNKIKTFLATKKPDNSYFWKYEPRYESLFPSDLQNWVLLVDYDKDGRKDLFTYTVGGIRVFKNITSENGFAWQLMSSQLKTEGFSGIINLYVQATDLPAIVDADNDGDIDILCFDFSGNTIEYHQNFSVERKLNIPFSFKKVQTCWGGVVKEHCNDFSMNRDCPSLPASAPANGRVAHAGNALWVGDLDGDGLKDALLGHISCTTVAALSNKGGNGTAARITNFTKDFPALNPINFTIFPSVFYEDLDFDTIPDMVSSPSVYGNESQLIDFSKSAWFYKNEGTANNLKLTYKQTDFLQDNMIDVGENAAPALADIDGDGDLDLLVGSSGSRTDKGYRAGFQYYKNVGNKSQASFVLETTDFLEISKNLQLTNTKPFFADIDNNGTTDFGFWANSINGMIIRYIPNQNPRGQAYNLDFSQLTEIPNPTNFSLGENLLFYDFDQDGKTDMLVGKNSGNVEFNRNTTGGKTPEYKLTDSRFGGLDINFDTRSLSFSIADFDGRGTAQLLTTDYYGATKLYQNFAINTNLKADSSLIYNEITKKNEFRSLGSSISNAVGDLDNDGLSDLILGTNTGGLLFLKNLSVKKVPVIETEKILIVYPNPTSNFVYIKAPSKGSLSLYNLMGQLLKNLEIDSSETSLDLTLYPAGIYLIKWTGQDGTQLGKKVVLVR